jgi:hypothetical protein
MPDVYSTPLHSLLEPLQGMYESNNMPSDNKSSDNMPSDNKSSDNKSTLKEGMTVVPNDISDLQKMEKPLEDTWNDVVAKYKELNQNVQEIKPLESAVVNRTAEGDKIQDPPVVTRTAKGDKIQDSNDPLNEMEAKQKHVQGMKMRMQQDLIQLADQNGLIIILGAAFIVAAFILLLLLGYS